MDIWEKFQVDSNPGPQDHQSNTLTTRLPPQQMENLWYLCCDLLMYTVNSPDPDPNFRGWSQLPNPNECNSTLMSITGGTYPHPDTYIYKCSLVVLNLGSPCNLRTEDPTFAQFHQPRSQGCIRRTLAQSSDCSILIGGQFLNRTFKNCRDSNSVSPI